MAVVEIEYQRRGEDLRTLELSMEGEANETVTDAAIEAVPDEAQIERVELIGPA